MSGEALEADARTLLAVLTKARGHVVPHATLRTALGDRSHRLFEAVHCLRGLLGMRRHSRSGPLLSVKGIGYKLTE